MSQKFIEKHLFTWSYFLTKLQENNLKTNQYNSLDNSLDNS